MNSFTCNFKKQFLKAAGELLGFILLLFLFDRLVFMLIQRAESAYYQQNTIYSLKDKFAMASKIGDYQILIFGTSRTYDGIHPLYIRNQLGIKAFKEAFVGKGPMYNYYFYQEYKKQMGIPRVVIYGVDYFMYNITTWRSWMQRFDPDIIDALYYNRGVSMLLANKGKIDNLLNTFLNTMQKDLSRVEHTQIEHDCTLMGNYLGQTISGDVVTQKPPQYNKVFFFRYPGREGVYFSRLLEELHRDKVTVLLVSLPDYIGTYWTNKFHRQYLRAFRYYQRKYANVHFLNYNSIKKFDLKNPEYFINGGWGRTNSHLSQAGAEVLNRLFIEDLRKVLPEHEMQKSH
ncbi:MAG: hypothetical protein NTZ12_12350 [Candidatus Aminicenantes bacterium]|nr:hypothetical protein [Candidatus Aminicenantes bacterium]